MSKLITPNQQRAVESLIHFIEQMFQNSSFDHEAVSYFVLYSLYSYAKHMSTVDITTVASLPCSKTEWKMIADQILVQLKPYVKIVPEIMKG